MDVAQSPYNKAAVHGMEAHLITNKVEILLDHFIWEDHVHNVLGQKRHSTCELLALKLHNQCRFLLQHTAKIVRHNPE
jgi:hypothetical protein